MRAAGRHPDPVRAAKVAIEAGADGITAHLREDRRHIRDDDIARLMAEIAQAAQSGDGGDARNGRDRGQDAAARRLPGAGAPRPRSPPKAASMLSASTTSWRPWWRGWARPASAFRCSSPLIPPRSKWRRGCGPRRSKFTPAPGATRWRKGAARPQPWNGRASAQARQLATRLGLEVHAGHGLNYETAEAIAALPDIVELNIGHFLVGEATFVGLGRNCPHDARRHGPRARQAMTIKP